MRFPTRSASRTSQIDPFEDETQLGRFNRLRLQRGFGKPCMKTAELKTFGPHCKTVTIPVNDAYPVASLREKHVQVPKEWILAKRIAHQRDQAIGAFAPIHRLRGHKHAYARGKAQHRLPLLEQLQ